MRKLPVWILVLTSIAFLTLSVTRAQRGASAPTRVSPALASTYREVPKTSTTAQGSVDLTTTAGDPFREPVAHFVGITQATLPVMSEQFGSGLLVLNRACFAEFPGTRACTRAELYQSIPPPPEWTAVVQVIEEGFQTGSCLGSDGLPTTCGSEAAPAICCGFK
jgi:hypothetical protein